MWPFKKKVHTAEDAVGSLRKSFDKMDFNNLEGMRILQTNCIRMERLLCERRKALQKKIKEVAQRVESYEEAHNKYVCAEKEAACLLEQVSKEEPSREQAANLRKATSEFKAVQFKLKSLERSKSDDETTEVLFNHLVMDMEDALHLIGFMKESLTRNIDRVKAATLLLVDEIEEVPVKESSIDILGTHIDISGIVDSSKKTAMLEKKLIALEKELDNLAIKHRVACSLKLHYDFADLYIRFRKMDNTGKFQFETYLTNSSMSRVYMLKSFLDLGTSGAAALQIILRELPHLLKMVEQETQKKNKDLERISTLLQSLDTSKITHQR